MRNNKQLVGITVLLVAPLLILVVLVSIDSEPTVLQDISPPAGMNYDNGVISTLKPYVYHPGLTIPPVRPSHQVP